MVIASELKVTLSIGPVLRAVIFDEMSRSIGNGNSAASGPGIDEPGTCCSGMSWLTSKSAIPHPTTKVATQASQAVPVMADHSAEPAFFRGPLPGAPPKA